MAQVRVDVVDSNGIHTQELHKGSVSETGVFVGQGIRRKVVASTTARLVGDANDLVSVASDIVDKVVALDVDRRDGSGQRGGADKTKQGLTKL